MGIARKRKQLIEQGLLPAPTTPPNPLALPVGQEVLKNDDEPFERTLGYVLANAANGDYLSKVESFAEGRRFLWHSLPYHAIRYHSVREARDAGTQIARRKDSSYMLHVCELRETAARYIVEGVESIRGKAPL